MPTPRPGLALQHQAGNWTSIRKRLAREHDNKGTVTLDTERLRDLVGAVNGFTDPNTENQDTVKDLREKIHEHQGLTLTETREDATIVLIADRSRSGFKLGLGSSGKDKIVNVKVLVQGTEMELSGSASASYTTQHPWGSAAGKVIDQLDKWVTANRAKLAEAR